MEKRRLILIVIISLVVGILVGSLYSTRMTESQDREQLSKILENHAEIKKHLTQAEHETSSLFGKLQNAGKSYPTFSADSIAVILEYASFVANLSAELTAAVEKIYEADSVALNQYLIRKQDLDKE